MAKTLTEQLKEAACSIESLTAELNEAKGRDSELSHDLGNKMQLLEASALEKAGLQAKLDELTAAVAERDQHIVELAAAIEQAKAGAAAAAQDQLARIGVPPVAAETPAPAADKVPTLAEHINILNGIADEKARSAYYTKNIAPLIKK